MDDVLDDFMAHFGVKGMKWGVTRAETGGASKPLLSTEQKQVLTTLALGGATIAAGILGGSSASIAVGTIGRAAQIAKRPSTAPEDRAGMTESQLKRNKTAKTLHVATLTATGALATTRVLENYADTHMTDFSKGDPANYGHGRDYSKHPLDGKDGMKFNPKARIEPGIIERR